MAERPPFSTEIPEMRQDSLLDLDVGFGLYCTVLYVEEGEKDHLAGEMIFLNAQVGGGKQQVIHRVWFVKGRMHHMAQDAQGVKYDTSHIRVQTRGREVQAIFCDPSLHSARLGGCPEHHIQLTSFVGGETRQMGFRHAICWSVEHRPSTEPISVMNLFYWFYRRLYAVPWTSRPVNILGPAPREMHTYISGPACCLGEMLAPTYFDNGSQMYLYPVLPLPLPDCCPGFLSGPDLRRDQYPATMFQETQTLCRNVSESKI